jgi:hypothetical protein
MKTVHVIFLVLLGACGKLAFAQSNTSPSASEAAAQPAAQAPMAEPARNNLPQEPSVLRPSPTFELVQVRVLSTTPVQVTGTQGTQLVYKTVYELHGQQFSVQLPQDPGEYLTLQVPLQSAPVPALMAGTVVQVPSAQVVPYAAYTSVLFVGALYRPLPFIASVHHPVGVGRMGRRGGRH